MKRSVLVVSLLLVAAAGCKKGGEGTKAPEPSGGGTRMGVQKERPKIGGVGEKRLGGVGTDLRATVDGKFVTVLLEAEKPRLEGVPQPMRVGELWVVPTAGGDAIKLGNGVTNMPGGQLLSADSRWALFLSGYNAALQAGELVAQDLADLKSERVHLGTSVSYFVPSDDSKRLAFVEDGVLKVGALPQGPFRAVSGEVATADFTTDGKTLYFRRRVSAGGGLFQLALDDEKKQPRKLTDQVGDFEATKDGTRVVYMARETVATPTYQLFTADAVTGKSEKLAEGVLRLQLSPDGKWLTWIQGESPDAPGEFWLAQTDGKGAKKLGDKVQDFSWALDSRRLVFRQNYRQISLVGTHVEHVGDLMQVTLPGMVITPIQKTCANYVFSPDGRSLAYTGSVFKPSFSRTLYLLRGDGEPQQASVDGGAGGPLGVPLKEWIYEYVFSPTNDRLFYRADCTREGRACLLYSIDVSSSAAKPVQEADSVYNFRISHDGGRVVFTYAQTTVGDLYDVSVLNLKTKERKTLEQDIRIPALFLADDGSKVAYLVGPKQKAGVYVASQVP